MQHLTKSQRQMMEDGAPASCFITAEERLQGWKDNPPKVMSSFHQVEKPIDPATLQLMKELEEAKNNKAKLKPTRATVEQEEQAAMISIMTNTRGSTQMSNQKDFAEMTGPEMVAAYNKLVPGAIIKKFKDKATALKRLAEATTAAKAGDGMDGAKAKADGMDGAKAKGMDGAKAKADGMDGAKNCSTNKLAAEFKARPGDNREKLLIAFDANYKKQVAGVDLVKAVYGSKNIEKISSLKMVIKGAEETIKKSKLPYQIKKEENADGDITWGLHPK